MRRLSSIIVIFLLGFTSIAAQEKFIEHTIVKGESVYSISKKYGVSIDAIFELNPNSVDIIYYGEILRIPNTNISQNNLVSDNSDFIDYQVKRGETKFGLSKRFGISIELLEQQNPHIINMLQAGHILKVDKTIKLKPRISSNKDEHVVVKGETLWNISKLYNVNLDNLIDVNSNQLTEFLQIGQTLVIPNNTTENKNLSKKQYIVKQGETKYSLAKRFNMSISELERKNPHIVNMLMTGHRLNINSALVIDESNTTTIADNDNLIEVIDNTNSKPNDAQQVSTTESTLEFSSLDNTTTPSDSTSNSLNTNKKVYADYVIQPKETLFGLSQKAEMTLEDLTKLNPKLRFTVNAGDIILMPIESVGIKTTDLDSISEPSNLKVVNSLEKNTALISNLDTSTTNGLYFYTPYSIEDLSAKVKGIQGLDNDNQNLSFIDFYRGAQMAMDSARALNIKFEVSLIEKNKSRKKIKLDSQHKKNALLIPFIEDNVEYPKIVSDENISIIDIETGIDAVENSIIYKPIPSEDFQKRRILNYIADKEAQVIVISDLDNAKNKELIVNTITDVKFLKVDKAGIFKDNNWQLNLDKDKLNYIILDSDKKILFLNTTTALMHKLPDYNIQLVLINASLIPKQTEVSNIRYKVLKLMFPSTIESSDKKSVIDFELKYRNLYDSKPSRHAILGFDITLDIVLRLSQNASFETTITNTESEHSHVKFNYKKTSSLNYLNTSLYIMQFDPNQGIIKLD